MSSALLTFNNSNPHQSMFTKCWGIELIPSLTDVAHRTYQLFMDVLNDIEHPNTKSVITNENTKNRINTTSLHGRTIGNTNTEISNSLSTTNTTSATNTSSTNNNDTTNVVANNTNSCQVSSFFSSSSLQHHSPPTKKKKIFCALTKQELIDSIITIIMTGALMSSNTNINTNSTNNIHNNTINSNNSNNNTDVDNNNDRLHSSYSTTAASTSMTTATLLNPRLDASIYEMTIENISNKLVSVHGHKIYKETLKQLHITKFSNLIMTIATLCPANTTEQNISTHSISNNTNNSDKSNNDSNNDNSNDTAAAATSNNNDEVLIDTKINIFDTTTTTTTTNNNNSNNNTYEFYLSEDKLKLILVYNNKNLSNNTNNSNNSKTATASTLNATTLSNNTDNKNNDTANRNNNQNNADENDQITINMTSDSDINNMTTIDDIKTELRQLLLSYSSSSLSSSSIKKTVVRDNISNTSTSGNNISNRHSRSSSTSNSNNSNTSNNNNNNTTGLYTLNNLPTIEFITGNIFEINWWNTADVMYMASLLFTHDMMLHMNLLIRLMKSNSCIITLKPLLLDIELHTLLDNDDNIETAASGCTAESNNNNNNVSSNIIINNNNNNHNSTTNMKTTHTTTENKKNQSLITADSNFLKLLYHKFTTEEQMKIRSNRVILRHESFFKMSWQMAKVYIYRINDNTTSGK